MIQYYLNLLEDKKHKVFKNGEYNLNLLGVRSKDMTPNTFNDKFIVFFKVNNYQNFFIFDCTTDPGLYWLQNPMNVNGTAIVKPGQYKGVWKLGKHKGYEALVQRRPITVFRDSNRDKEFDFKDEQSGLFGINCHRASSSMESKQVDKWSAGCQVFSDPYDFDIFMSVVKKAIQNYSNSFTYTLIEE